MKISSREISEKSNSFFQKMPRKPKNNSGQSKKGGFSTYKWQARIFIVIMLFLPMLYLFGYDMVTRVQSFILPFQDYNTGVWNNFKNFEHVWWAITSPAAGDTSLVVAFKNTLMYFAWNMLQTPIGVLLSYFLYKRIAGKKVFVLLLYIPSIVSSIVLVTAFKELTSMNGVLGAIMKEFGHPLEMSIYKNPETANIALLSYCIFFGLDAGIMFYHAAMTRIPHSIFEAARLDGVGPLREAVQIVVPLIMPTIGTQLVLGSMGFLTASGPILLFTQGEAGTTTLSFWMYWKIYQDPLGDLGVVSAMGLCMTLIGLPITLIALKLNNRIEPIQY